MFAEELAGNSSRKRQEENRARRRQLKQQQQQRKAAATSATTTTTMTRAAAAAVSGKPEVSAAAVVVEAKTTAATANSFPTSTATVSAATPASVAPTTSSSSKTPSSSSAVENALQQRQLRQELQLREKSALKIQSFYRAHRSHVELLNMQASLLTQRLEDLKTLRALLMQQPKKVEYIPPPATVTALVRQVMFLCRRFPNHKKSQIDKSTTVNANGIDAPTKCFVIRSDEDLIRLQQVLEYAVLPGMVGTDESLDPSLTWLNDGRLQRLLRLCLVVATRRGTSESVLRTMDVFFRTVLGINKDRSAARAVVVDEARLILPPVVAASPTMNIIHGPANTTTGPTAVVDLISTLRHHLLFSSSGGAPIPSDAARRREACFSARERTQNDILFQLVLDAILLSSSSAGGSERQLLESRLVAEILTIPLLTWRLSAASVTRLLHHGSSSSKGRVPMFLTMMQSFVHQHATALSAGRVASLLPTDVSLTNKCPATPTQCLLANLMKLACSCPSINGSDVRKLNYPSAAFFFRFLSTLLDVVPLATFSSRDSAVEWVCDGKSHHTPIVLSPVILEQCRLLLVDSFVRSLFSCAINNDMLRTDQVLREKTDKDRQHEQDLMGGSAAVSAASLAAKEARVDRTKGFWKSTSKWARKLTEGMSKSLPSSDKQVPASPSSRVKGPGMLVDTSSISRKLAHGNNDGSVIHAVLASQEEASDNGASAEISQAAQYDQHFFFALSRAYGIILARWGGGGRDDIVKSNKVREHPVSSTNQGNDKGAATSVPDPCTSTLLNVICFSTTTVPTAWALIQSDTKVVSDVYAVIDSTKSSTPIRSIEIHPKYNGRGGETTQNDGAVLLYIFVCCLAHALIVTDDTEIHDMDKPLPIHQVRRCIQVLKKLLYRACCLDDSSESASSRKSRYFGLSLISSSSRTMRDLYDRSSRRPLCVPKLWLVENLLDKDLRRCKKAEEYEALLTLPVLRICPFLVSFKRRLKLFERIVTTNRVAIQGENSQNPFAPGLKPGIPVRIVRGRVLEDGLLTLNKLGRNLRQRIAVQYVSETGATETGVDVGGLFKEFWTDLSALAFDPNYALFRVTEGAGNCLYPNPSSGAAHGPDHIVLFEFLGRILGKALFEGITIHPRFAHFFLSFLKGSYNYLNMLPDLSTLDPQLYHNLMFLKTYEGDAEDLCLTFTVADDDFGGNREVPLIPNGANIPVTNTNKQRYIGLMAKHYVCDRVEEQSRAFTRGLWEVIDREWLKIFSEPELQVLISGATDGKLDVADMRSNTRYAGGYTPLDRNIHRFWNVVSSFNSQQQAELLRFATSCERPPPLGFASMNPPFTIQRVGILRDGDKLPTASTCFNVLKLPTYSSEKVLRERLLYAIQAGAGFELT